MENRASTLKDLLLSLTTRVREIRGLALIDGNGLPLVSTLKTGSLEERLAAFGGRMSHLLAAAREDFALGPVYLAQVTARDRQLFVAPLEGNVVLAAVADSTATPHTIAMHLLALARDLGPTVVDP